jgi:hypothetical protein
VARVGAALLPIARDRFGSYGPGLWTFVVLLALAAIAIACIRNPAHRIEQAANATV